MEFDNLKIKCMCGGNMKKITTEWKGITVRGWRCDKCHEEVLNPLDAQRALDIDKARKKNLFKVKVRTVGKSKVVTIPQLILEAERLREGQKVEWKLEGGRLVLGQ